MIKDVEAKWRDIDIDSVTLFDDCHRGKDVDHSARLKIKLNVDHT